MICFGNAVSSHSGLIPLKTAYKKRGELLWAITSKKNFINNYPSFRCCTISYTGMTESKEGKALLFTFGIILLQSGGENLESRLSVFCWMFT